MTSHEAALADANLQAYTQMRAERDAALAELAQAVKHADYWRVQAEDTVVDLHGLQDRYSHLYRQFESLQTWVARGMAIQTPPPIAIQGVSAALLAELEAARAVVAAAKKVCAVQLNSADRHARMVALSSALKVYRDVMKASTE